jgi:hypothetical protein
MQFARNQRNLDEGASPSFCAGRKLGVVEQALLWTWCQDTFSKVASNLSFT